ncbi:hypothetical protein EWH99_06965 [Sporolactobacillus sp. THM7-7]|nr:hypothetical protein EWH99_06965 [Sporolactobacillus sp. THM7-7]
MDKKNRLFVDADSCPVKKEILAVAVRFGICPIFVASYASFSSDREATWVFVDQEKEAADLYIANHVRQGDFVVTQDIGLAALVLRRGVFVLSIRGKEISENNISRLLDRRYLARQSLRSGKKLKGPKPFTDEDRKKFSDTLTKLLCRLDH